LFPSCNRALAPHVTKADVGRLLSKYVPAVPWRDTGPRTLLVCRIRPNRRQAIFRLAKESPTPRCTSEEKAVVRSADLLGAGHPCSVPRQRANRRTAACLGPARRTRHPQNVHKRMSGSSGTTVQRFPEHRVVPVLVTRVCDAFPVRGSGRISIFNAGVNRISVSRAMSWIQVFVTGPSIVIARNLPSGEMVQSSYGLLVAVSGVVFPALSTNTISCSP
jgi:hypothetical protein